MLMASKWLVSTGGRDKSFELMMGPGARARCCQVQIWKGKRRRQVECSPQMDLC